ncbi:MAG: UxaA family hydrolase [Candidatus Metalachnospira sp.]|nr:UxaA family hydrolase [Candidatus Metalachnospira sp.]
MESVLHIDKKDNLVTCLRDIKKGEVIEIEGTKITVNSDIPIFHKLAISNIEKGGYCYKYGQIIGTATKEIKKGDYVHVHNCESTRGRGDKK